MTGPRADEIIAYARRYARRTVVTAAQRFPVRTEAEQSIGAERDPFAGRSRAGSSTSSRAARARLEPHSIPRELFATLPIAVLAPREADGAARA